MLIALEVTMMSSNDGYEPEYSTVDTIRLSDLPCVVHTNILHTSLNARLETRLD